MRRRLAIFLPIVWFALLGQLIAPLGALNVVARAASDPLAMASICAGSSEHGHTAPADGPANHANCCFACGVAIGGGLAVDPPLPVFAVLQRAYQRVVWLEDQSVLSAVRAGSNAQARAPPVLS